MEKQKRVLAIHDISCIGKCSLTAALPIISAAGIETAVIPTAVLSTHTGGFENFTYRDLTDDILPIARHWQSLGIEFDAIYTGFLGSEKQVDIVLEVFNIFAHLQQVDMESNGKSVNRFGEPVNYPTGPVLFGEPGTNGQHSFYQLLHQGTDIVPLQFVGFRNNQMETDVDIQGSTSQQKLCANVAAQIVAFACGKADENKNKNFEGGRPSSIIIGDQVNPKTLGALLAHFENKIMFQGFLWNVNSFDQEGVQLGKVLAKRVLAHETDGALKVFSDLLNI